jgi:hypothetical protein
MYTSHRIRGLQVEVAKKEIENNVERKTEKWSVLFVVQMQKMRCNQGWEGKTE